MRGLKQSRQNQQIQGQSKSHPLWVRGLKHNPLILHYVLNHVAPFVGAWIETVRLLFFCTLTIVAPFVGAWIETSSVHRDAHAGQSHPLWVRGLKPTT